MPLIAHDDATLASDAEAITGLHQAFEAQRRDFTAHPHSTLEERSQRIGALAMMMLGNRDRIRRAVSEDFAVHPELFTDLIECLGIAGRAQFALSQLPQWMADEERYADPALYGDGKAFVRHQPKGVVGNIPPWNFPFDIGVGPVVEMLAAGNRVIIKPSDYTPACGELLASMVRDAFDPLHVTVVTGGVELARTFPTLPWDHLLYTGSPNIGREVMKAAAANLTPVTLELGGKCPAILLDDAVEMRAVANILGTKMIKNGQMCISVDYVLVPRARMGEFVDLALRYARENVPGYSRGDDCTGIITERHLDRLLAPAGGRCGLRGRRPGGGRPGEPRNPADAPVPGARPGGRARPHAGGDLRSAAPGEALPRRHRGHLLHQRRRAAAGPLRLRRRRCRDPAGAG